MAMIGRIDDTSKLLYENLKGSKQHSRYSVLCKLCWSKIVNDERDTPDSDTDRSQNTSYCIVT